MKFFKKIQLLAISSLGFFLPSIQAVFNWQDIAIPLVSSLLTSGLNVGINTFLLKQRLNSQEFNAWGTQDAPPDIVNYQRKCLKALGYKNADTFPVKLLNASVSSGLASVEALAATYGPFGTVGIWHNPHSISSGLTPLVKRACGHEAKHVAQRHIQQKFWTEKLWASLGSFAGATVAHCLTSALLNTHAAKKITVGAFGAELGDKIETITKIAAGIGVSAVGNKLGAKFFNEHKLQQLEKMHEEEADIEGARITGTAVFMANKSREQCAREDLRHCVKEYSKIHASNIQQYVYFKRLAQEEGNGHLVNPLEFTLQYSNGTTKTYHCNSSKDAEVLTKLINGYYNQTAQN